MQNISSYQTLETFPHELVLYGLAEELWEGSRVSQQKKEHVNIGTRGMFTTTVLVGGGDRVLATQSEKHR